MNPVLALREALPGVLARSGAPTRNVAVPRGSGIALPPAFGQRVVLAGTRRAQLRPVRPSDAEAAQAFVMGLSPQSRRLRFHGALKRLPDDVLQQMTAVDFHRHVAWVAEACCDDGGNARLVGDARYVRGEVAGEAEFALAVADDWQGRGLGSALLQRLLRHARVAGLAWLQGGVLAENAPMLNLMQRFGALVRDDLDDVTLVQVSLPVREG
jgi:acetyltransferase